MLIDTCVSPSFRPHKIITDYNIASIGTNFGPSFVHICHMQRLNDGYTQKQTNKQTDKQTNINTYTRARTCYGPYVVYLI